MSDWTYASSAPPSPQGEDAIRWEHTRMRRRLLSDAWVSDLEIRLQEEIGTIRRDAWGRPKTSSNPFATLCREMSALYTSAPEVRAPSGDLVFGALARALGRLWPQMPRYQTYVVGCREYLWRLSTVGTGAGARVVYRPVPPDHVVAISDPDDPSRPLAIREARERKGEWTYDVLDVRDLDAPVYRIEDREGKDITASVLGELPDYPYRRSDGTPVLPYVLHHADCIADTLWHWTDGAASVEASLDLAVLATYEMHAIRDASWPQRYLIDCEPAGLDVVEGETTAANAKRSTRRSVATDPGMVLLLRAFPDSKNPQAGQWEAGADVAALEETIASISNRLAIDAGLPASDIQRMGGTARSGYAIALSNEGKRTAARRFAPAMRPADEEMVALTAIMLNRATGSHLPEEGYEVAYRDLPLSPDELRERRAHVIELMGAGLMSRTQGYVTLNPGLSETAAKVELANIDAERASERSTEPSHDSTPTMMEPPHEQQVPVLSGRPRS